MIPILYQTITEGTVPSHYGIGALSDALDCVVEETRNGAYELTMTYAAQGIHASDIQVGRYIKAQPNFTDNPQLFRIYKVGKQMNGRFKINAEHISYALSGKVITSGTANNIVSACVLLQAQAGSFTITTTKTTAGDFKITEPSSVKSWFGGKQGSLLDVYGGGEWSYDNFTAKLWAYRGVQTPRTTIRYGKNLTELQQEVDCSNLYTHVLAFYKNDNGEETGSEVATGLSGTKRVLVVDATQDFESVPSTADLDTYATAYIGAHNLTTPVSNFTLNFVQSGQLFDRVDLCDVVNVYFEALDINASVKCIRVKWDVLRGRYIETEFGDPKANITDTISDASAAANAASIDASEAQNLARSKARVFVTTPEPPYDVGDIWTDSNDIYYCTTPRTETITGSGSGSIVEFETLIGGALTGCEIDIEGNQDLHGYTKPWAGGCGKNIACFTSNGYIDGSGNFQPASSNGLCPTYTLQSGESMTITKGSFYSFGYCAISGGSVIYRKGSSGADSETYTATQNCDFYVWFNLGSGTNSQAYFDSNKCQVEKGTTATSWEPYENVCPLTAYTEANVSISGKNLFRNNHISGSASGVTYTTNDDGTISLTGTATGTAFILPMGSTGVFYPSGTYTMKKSGNSGIQMLLRENNTSGNDAIRATTADTTRTLTGGLYACLIRIASGTVTDGITLYPQLEVGSTSTEYKAYEAPEVFSISFDTAGTVYKGTLNVLTGELSVTHKVVDLGDLDYTYSSGTGTMVNNTLVYLPPTDTYTVPDAVCENYAPASWADVTDGQHNGVFGFLTSPLQFRVRDTNYSDPVAFKTAVTGVKMAYPLATPATFNLTPQEIVSAIGNNVIFADTGDISISFFVDGFTMNDWSLATDYISESRLEDAIANASDIITGTAGGYVVWHDSNADGEPDEILIMNTASIDTATKVWRWNAGGLGYSTTGYAGTYDTAIDSQGRIVANKITTGNLDASLVTIEHLKATMFEGGKLVLGGAGNVEGVFQLKNENDIVIGEMNKDGLKFYGAGPEGSRPYVLLNNSVGFQGCDANGTPIFWVNQDEFSMKKCVAENEISACKKIRFIPVTLKDGNDQVINDGVAVVAIVQT